jgi:hypothetical protein
MPWSLIMNMRIFLRFSTALIAVGGLYAASGIAQVALFTPVGPPPRTCTMQQVTVVAGQNGDPTAQFPRSVDCPGPDCPTGFNGVGMFSAWEYAFINPNQINLSNVVFTVAADQTILFSEPPATVSSFCKGDTTTKAGERDCNDRYLRINPNINSSQFYVLFLTPTGVGPRIETAIVKSGNYIDSCLVAGPGTVDTEPAQAPLTDAIHDLPGCGPTLVGIDRQGRVDPNSVQLSPEGLANCQVTETPAANLTLNGNPLEFFNSWNILQGPLVSAGSCLYSYPSSGGMTTITCTNCCIDAKAGSKTLGKCVTKTSTTVCKPGT